MTPISGPGKSEYGSEEKAKAVRERLSPNSSLRLIPSIERHVAAAWLWVGDLAVGRNSIYLNSRRATWGVMCLVTTHVW